MPIVEKLMDSLTARYGKVEGERIYYAMEGEGKGPFGPRGKYRELHLAFAEKHGVPPIEGQTKTPRPRKRGRGART